MISIVTSLYNSDRYLDSFSGHVDRFIAELKAQNFSFELIVIANDPTTRESRLEQEFSGQPWFKFVPIGREPLYATWNRGVGLAGGDIVGFWNADDIRYAEALPVAQGLFDQGGELVYFPFKIDRYVKIFGHHILVNKQVVDRHIPQFSEAARSGFVRSMHCGPFFMFTKGLYKKVGPFDEQFRIAGDFDWCARAAKLGAMLVKAKCLAGEFRVDGGGLSAGGSARHIVENNVIYKRNQISEKIQPEDSELAKEYHPEIIKFQGKSISI